MSTLRQWLEAAPPGTTVQAEEILARLDTPEPVSDPAPEPTAPERLWSCPPNTRLTVKELADALSRPTSYVYGLTSAKQIPHTKLDGQITFTASEIRRWLVEREERVSL